jgi:dethiobiotin synthetase
LLSIQALRSRKIPLVGIAFVGEANLDSEQVICAFAKAKWLGRLPLLNPLNREFLADAFASNFALRDFQ